MRRWRTQLFPNFLWKYWAQFNEKPLKSFKITDLGNGVRARHLHTPTSDPCPLPTGLTQMDMDTADNSSPEKINCRSRQQALAGGECYLAWGWQSWASPDNSVSSNSKRGSIAEPTWCLVRHSITIGRFVQSDAARIFGGQLPSRSLPSSPALLLQVRSVPSAAGC